MNDADGKVIIGTTLETKSVDAQIKELEKKLEIMTQTLETDMKIPVELRMTEDERLKLESDIEKTRNRIISLKGSVEEVGNETSEMSKKMSKGFDKGIKSLKKFAIRLVGIRTIYGVVSKASSAWLSQDTELAQKLQNVWIGLGSIVAPVIEMISDALLKGLGYLNVFLKALTGVDYIAKANAKALEKQTKAQKGLNKATQDYDFDVIRKQQDVSSTSGTGIDTSGLIKIPELDDRIVKKLQDMAYWLKENWHWIKEVGIILGITFGAIAIGKLLANIGNLINNKTNGLLGLKGLLVGLATTWVISLYLEGYKEIKKDMDNLKQDLNDLIELDKEVTNKTQKVNDAYLNALKSGNLTKEQRDDIKSITLDTTNSLIRESTAIANNTGLWQMLTGVGQKAQKEMEEEIKQVNILAERMKVLYENGDITAEEYDHFANDVLPAVREQAKRAGVSTKELDDTIANMPKSKDIKIKITAEDKTSPTINSLKNKLIDLSKSFLRNTFGTKKTQTKGYAIGGIVTQPTRALIGEAGYPEAVVPMTKDYLSTLASEIGRYSNNSGGGVVNVYLDGRLIQRQVKNTQNDRNFATNN